MKFENFIKGPLTTLLGFFVLVGCVLGWAIDYLTDWQAGGGAMVAFALMFMRDNIAQWMKDFVSAVINKFFK